MTVNSTIGFISISTKKYSAKIGSQIRLLYKLEGIFDRIIFKEALKNVSDSKTL